MASGAADEPITLRAITRRNWQRCIRLRLAPEQADKLATNLYSLAEAYVDSRCIPRAIYAGATMIGFVMTEYDERADVYTIPRFMIDRDWQGQGYGARALAMVLAALHAEHPEAAVLISITPDNLAARRFYEQLGFVDTGERQHGEQVLRLE